MDEAERRRQIIADGLYLEARSHALVNHSRALCIEAQELRMRVEVLLAWHIDMSRRGSRALRQRQRE